LTDDELKNCGLNVTAGSEKNDVWLSKTELNIGSLAWHQGNEWLVPQPANDAKASAAKSPAWLNTLCERMDELRVIAADEGLGFSEDSAASAVAFARSLNRSRQPSAFLLGNGKVRLLWVTEANEQIGLQFRSDEQVQFVLFKLREKRLVHTMGSDTSSGVLQTIAAMGLMHVLDG
jgi:hypothetical protein